MRGKPFPNRFLSVPNKFTFQQSYIQSIWSLPEEIDLLDTMLSSLVELLEEKGILTQEEYEKRIMEKVKIK